MKSRHDLSKDSAAAKYLKIVTVMVTFASSEGELRTLEGSVKYAKNDAILTGVEGERWPVNRAHFDMMYEPYGDFSHGRDGQYRKKDSEFIWARRMKKPFTVHLVTGDVLAGKLGDWLTQYQDGKQGVVADEIFKKTYQKVG